MLELAHSELPGGLPVAWLSTLADCWQRQTSSMLAAIKACDTMPDQLQLTAPSVDLYNIDHACHSLYMSHHTSSSAGQDCPAQGCKVA